MQLNKVIMYKAYKYRLYPNKSQEELILKHIGCCRYIYNYGLEKKIKVYQETKQGLSRFEIQLDLQLNSFVHDQIYENGEDDSPQC